VSSRMRRCMESSAARKRKFSLVTLGIRCSAFGGFLVMP
jgi:hypothetical protein